MFPSADERARERGASTAARGLLGISITNILVVVDVVDVVQCTADRCFLLLLLRLVILPKSISTISRGDRNSPATQRLDRHDRKGNFGFRRRERPPPRNRRKAIPPSSSKKKRKKKRADTRR